MSSVRELDHLDGVPGEHACCRVGADLDEVDFGNVQGCAAGIHWAQTPLHRIGARVLDALGLHARRLWDGLGCRGAIRVDFMVTDGGEVYALEVNTTPGLSRGSNFLTGARWYGLELEQVVLAMLHEAITRPAYDVPLPAPT